LKKALTALALTAALAMPSCLGPNNLHNGLRNWNAEMSDMDWLNEVVFLAMTIIPVYGICYLGDIVIFNTIDYWGDKNPINDPGPFPTTFGD
jgi:hypothetical protein